MKKIKKIFFQILLLPYYIVKLTIKGFKVQVHFFVKGFSTLSLFLSRGFYFYVEEIFKLLKKITRLKFLQNIIDYFEVKKEEPSHIVLIIAWLLTLVTVFDHFYLDNKSVIEELPVDNTHIEAQKEQVSLEDSPNDFLSTDFNLYRKYSKYKLKDISIYDLKEKNIDTVAWIIVEGTNINYPIVQTNDNDYYLFHSYDRSYNYNGWTFMDYRNEKDLSDRNTIFYGHNLLNGTAFGSLRMLFENSKDEYNIMVITDDQQKHIYKVFSAYYIDAEVYYLQTNFIDNDSYQEFLNTIASRNIISVDNTVTVDDKIITLSTCTDDNSGRKVVHAKLIE